MFKAVGIPKITTQKRMYSLAKLAVKGELPERNKARGPLIKRTNKQYRVAEAKHPQKANLEEFLARSGLPMPKLLEITLEAPIPKRLEIAEIIMYTGMQMVTPATSALLLDGSMSVEA